MLSFLQFITESDDFPHFTSAEHVKKHVEGKHPGVSLQFHDSGKHQPDHASLSMIDVPKEHQRKGIGSYAMRAINHYADHNNKTVTLSPEHRGKGQPSKSKLVDFYKSHGYKPNKGRHKDYRFSDSMIRTPASLKEDDHHKGFDVESSKKHSAHWRGIVGKNPEVSHRIGTKSYWDREVVPKLHENESHFKPSKEHDPVALGRKIKAATTGDNDSYKILDSHPHTKGSTWQAGGCGVLAHALHKHLPGSKLVDVHNKKTGHTEHVAVHHGDHIYDADGATPAKHFIKKFAKREMKSHQDLELTPHDSARAKKSDISTHPGLIDKTHKHLTSHIG